MANRIQPEHKSVQTNSNSYKTVLSWEIEKFEDWWSSRTIARSERERMEEDDDDYDETPKKTGENRHIHQLCMSW